MNSIRLRRDDSGVNILLEYLFSLIVIVIIFTILVLLIGNVTNISDRIALKEEYDIISNDVANRISAFSSEVYLNDQRGLYDSTVVSDESTYFDLPEPVRGKQYQVDITYDNDPLSPTYKKGTAKVLYVSDSTISSTAEFSSNINVEGTSFNSHQGSYELFYNRNNPSGPSIIVRNSI